MSGEGDSKFSIMRVISEIRNPTNAGTRFIKYSFIGISLGLVYYKGIRPVVKERQFHKDQEFANNLFEMEMKQKQQQQSS